MRRAGGPRRRRDPEAGFTLIELMITVAMLGVGMAWITNMFFGAWQLWKRSMDEIVLQQNIRRTMGVITLAMRECSPGTVAITTPAGSPTFSEIKFTTGRRTWWWFKQTGKKIYAVHQLGAGSATDMLTSDIDALTFIYPSFQDTTLVDVSITGRIVPYARSPKPVIVQLTERVMMRNP